MCRMEICWCNKFSCEKVKNVLIRIEAKEMVFTYKATEFCYDSDKAIVTSYKMECYKVTESNELKLIRMARFPKSCVIEYYIYR